MDKERDLLKNRAEKFLNYGIESFEKGDYEISAFFLEQAAQLYLKHTLDVLIGDFPKTHQIKRLLQDVIKVSGSKDLKVLATNNPNLIADLESAYITSRYIPATFSKEQVENMLKFVKQLEECLKKIWI